MGPFGPALALACRIVLAAILAFAAVAKIADGRALPGRLRAMGVMPRWFSVWIAFVLPVVELAVAATLVFAPGSAFPGLVALALLVRLLGLPARDRSPPRSVCVLRQRPPRARRLDSRRDHAQRPPRRPLGARHRIGPWGPSRRHDRDRCARRRRGRALGHTRNLSDRGADAGAHPSRRRRRRGDDRRRVVRVGRRGDRRARPARARRTDPRRARPLPRRHRGRSRRVQRHAHAPHRLAHRALARVARADRAPARPRRRRSGARARDDVPAAPHPDDQHRPGRARAARAPRPVGLRLLHLPDRLRRAGQHDVGDERLHRGERRDARRSRQSSRPTVSATSRPTPSAPRCAPDRWCSTWAPRTTAAAPTDPTR